MRPIERATCSCGGTVAETEPTADEEKGRCSCCIRVLRCEKCGTRFVLELEAPEME